MKYRKKPVVVDAEFLLRGMQGELVAEMIAAGKGKHCEDDTYLIETLEGTMIGRPGDWLIKGIKGEFYPCRHDIFIKTYDPQ